MYTILPPEAFFKPEGSLFVRLREQRQVIGVEVSGRRLDLEVLHGVVEVGEREVVGRLVPRL